MSSRSLRAPAVLLAVALVGSLASWLGLIIGIRSVEPDVVGPFVAVWSAYFTVVAAYSGVQQESSRALTAARDDRGARLGQASAAIGVVGAGAGLLVASGASTKVGASVTVLIALGLLASALEAGVIGAAVARTAIDLVALTLTADALLRLAFVAGASGLGTSEAGTFLALSAAASIAATVLALSAGGCRYLRLRVGPVWAVTRRMTLATAAAVLSAFIITGAPVLVRVLGHLDTLEEAKALGLLSLTRAPVLLPLLAIQSWLVSWLAVVGRLQLALLRAFGLVVVLTALAVAGSILLGELVIRLMLGSTFLVTVPQLAMLVAASGSLGILIVMSLAAIATDRHSLSVIAWAATLVLTGVLLPLTGTTLEGIAIALALPPLIVGSAGGVFLTRGGQQAHA